MKASINLKDKKVLIVGGGKQALRKGNKLTKEQADVYYCALSYEDEIPKSKRLSVNYHEAMLDHFFLVVAATNQFEINHQIVLDAHSHHILCASIHYDKAADFHFLREENLEYLEVALTTNSAYPAIGKEIMNDIKQLYYQKYHERIQKLAIIRQYVLKNCDEEKRSLFLKSLLDENEEWINFLVEAIQYQKAVILCFHGNSKENMTYFQTLLQKIDLPATIAYLNKNEVIKSIQEVKEIMKYLKITTRYEIITLFLGKIDTSISKQIENENVYHNYLTTEEMKKLMNQLDPKALFIFHENKKIDIKQQFSDYSILYMNEKIKQNHQKTILMFLLKGKHFDDLSKQLQDNHLKPLIAMKQYQDLLIKKINQHE